MVDRLTLLQTFVAVARAGRMKEAAERLALTPGAVSQRIRELEEAAGRRLFVRGREGVQLSPAGAAMFAALDEPWRAIETVEASLKGRTSRPVVVNTVASFATGWLVPRLAALARQYPEIEVSVETDGRLVDLKREPVDLAIRHGLGDYPGLDSAWLVAPELIVVASPDLLRSGPAIAEPADCLAFPLLHDSDRGDWPLWFKAQGVTPPKPLKGPSFSDDHLLVRAAVAGQGLALVRDVYARDELRSGQLVQPLTLRWPTHLAYYIVAYPPALERPAVRQLRDWLVAEARERP